MTAAVMDKVLGKYGLV